MKSRIILNFNDLHGICEETKAYRDALDEMKYAIEKINLRLESENSGEAVNALVDNSKELLKDIHSCYLEVNDLNKIFTSYVDGMSYIISPKNPSKNMLVDRDDIWWNLDSIRTACSSISNVPSTLNLSSFSSELSEDEKQNRIDNARKVQEIIGLTKRYEYILQDSVYDLERLFNTKVVDFETMDDEFGKKAGKDIYNNYTSILERIVDYEVWNISTTFKFIKGILFSIKDFVFGICSIVIGVSKYISNCEIAIISDALTFINCDEPNWIKCAKENRDVTNVNIKETAKALLNDPMILVEGTAEVIHNAYEEEGIAFCSGYAVMELLGAKGIGNLAKSGKLSKVSKIVNKTVDGVKAAKVADSIHDVDKALDVGSDLKKVDKVSDVTKGVSNADKSIPTKIPYEFMNDTVEHIFNGVVKNPGTVDAYSTGWHYMGSGAFNENKIIQITRNADEFGTIEAKVEIGGVIKDGISTLFSDKYTSNKVVDMIMQAHMNKKLVPGSRGLYRGVANNGITIEMYLYRNAEGCNISDIITAYPVHTDTLK